ncbi:MAG: M48 family metalloprotease, partial [Betaproteobacteria bacterium]|nr:M48 family metalloprotease [Betaproteobacteria bacterium]
MAGRRHHSSGLSGCADENTGQIDAVIAHELGHLAHRHATRQLIRHTTVSVVLAVWLATSRPLPS